MAVLRVFVLSTGRSGTLTFARACSHITNYSSGHETRITNHQDRLSYPDSHIEVDHRLAFFLGSLDKLYPDAYYVHLLRAPERVVESWVARENPQSLIQTWPPTVFYWSRGWPREYSRVEAARLMVRTINDNIEVFMRDKPGMKIQIEDPHPEFRQFWRAIGAEGDSKAAHHELTIRHNARQ